MIIKAVLFDMIGTTVKENDPGLISNCFLDAFNDNNILIHGDLIKKNRGKDKNEMIETLLTELNYPLNLSKPILDSFTKNIENNLDNFSENKGFREIIEFLIQRDIKIGLATGFTRNLFEKIFRHLNWNEDWFNYIGIAEETGRGRPSPEGIFDMMNKLNINNSEFLKVGDTIADIREGKNANVYTLAILSGTQDEKEILNQQPDFVIRSLIEIKEIIN